MPPKGGIRFLLRARQRASCTWEGLPPAWPIFNSQNAPKHKPAAVLPRTALAIPCTPPFRLQKPTTAFIFGSGETLTLPKIIRAAARLVPLGGPSSHMR